MILFLSASFRIVSKVPPSYWDFWACYSIRGLILPCTASSSLLRLLCCSSMPSVLLSLCSWALPLQLTYSSSLSIFSIFQPLQASFLSCHSQGKWCFDPIVSLNYISYVFLALPNCAVELIRNEVLLYCFQMLVSHKFVHNDSQVVSYNFAACLRLRVLTDRWWHLIS